VRYVSPNSGRIVSSLLELVEMDARDLSARAMYQTFKGVLEKFEIPIHNILGMASDGASVMVGKHNSFYSHLKEEVKNVILLKCICHSAHLVAGKACAELPQEIESFMRLVYTTVENNIGKTTKRVQR
jgi:hypothetical protein